VEGNKDVALGDLSDPRRDFKRAPPRLDEDHVALLDVEFLSVLLRELDESFRRSVLQGLRTSRLCAGVEVVDDATGREAERVVVVGVFFSGLVVALLENSATVGTKRLVLCRADDGTGEEVVTVGFDVVAKSNKRGQLRGMGVREEKDVQIRRELAVGVQTLCSVRVLLVARPLNARTASKLYMKGRMSKKEKERGEERTHSRSSDRCSRKDDPSSTSPNG
jgi:hypothetical protein